MKKIKQNDVLVGGWMAGGELSGGFGAVFSGEVTFVLRQARRTQGAPGDSDTDMCQGPEWGGAGRPEQGRAGHGHPAARPAPSPSSKDSIWIPRALSSLQQLP